MVKSFQTGWSASHPQQHPFGRLCLTTFVLVVSTFPLVAPGLQDSDNTAANQEPAEPFTLVEGQITDPMGVGQKNVKVSAFRKNEDGTEGALLASGTTDGLGDFKLTTISRITGDIYVKLTKPLYVTVRKEFTVGTREYPPFLADSLEGSVVVIGTVMDEKTGDALTEANVLLKASERDWQTKTDNDGRFMIKNVLPGEGMLIVSAKGYGRDQQRVSKLEDFGELVVALKPEKIVRIHVEDELGKHVPKTTVEILDQPRNDLRTAITDEHGDVTFKGIHGDAGSLLARLTHRAFVSDAEFDREVALPGTERTVTQRFVLTRAGKIRGTVHKQETDDILYGARVMTGQGSDQSPRAWTDFEGHYEIDGVAPGEALVTVHMAGYAPEMQRVSVEAGQVAVQNFKLQKGASVPGTVQDEIGNPVAGAYIDAIEWRGESTLGLRTISNQKGEFVFDSAPHDEFKIQVFARGTDRVTQDVSVKQKEPIVITLKEAPRPGKGMITSAVRKGDSVPDAKLKTITGETIELGQLEGKLILIDFWATWCTPCIGEIPHLKKTFATFGKRDDFVMIGVSLDDDEKALKKFVKKKEMNWHQVVGESGGAQVAADGFGVEGIPAIFLIGKDGKVLRSEMLGDELVEAIKPLLKDDQ